MSLHSAARAVTTAPTGPPLSPEERAAVDAVIECARPDGGWTYVCNPPTGPHGVVTHILIRARQLAEPFGGAGWDVLVLRSPGTPAAGMVLLEAWRRGGDGRDLAVARRAGDLFVDAQLPSGGWASEMPVVGPRLAGWFRWLNQWTALDDDVTSGAARFLLELGVATGDVKYGDAARRALDLLLAAQLPDGAFPLTWRPALLRRVSPSFEDLASTNDAATAGPIRALLAGSATLGDSRYAAAARRGGDWLLAAQGPPPLAAWAQQYDREGRPGPGRRFEPSGYAAWESREMLDALLAIAQATGDARYCRAVPAAVAWFLRSRIAPGCWARLYDPADGSPLFAAADGRRVASADEAKRPYKWTGDYGIPGLLAELGLAADGSPLPPSGPPPPQRLFGDAGACPGTVAIEDAPDDENPRARIVRAAVLLGRSSRPARSPCSASLAIANAPAGDASARPVAVESTGDSR
ncbi:MAG TPA: pectate lyase [Candidatus Binatia bacterium]|nr:pectate lyase [Candidatus Binatia bacterium]